MSDYTKVSADAFNEIQKEAGVILSKFDPNLSTKIADADILFTTTGGVSVNYKMRTIDYGEDIDNTSNGTMQLTQIDDDEGSMSFTAVNVTAESVKATLGAADVETVANVTGGTLKKITPRKTLKITDFKELWWVGEMTNGGYCAAHIKNGLSTDGFGLKTTKKGKGNVSVTITAFSDLDNIDDPKMEFYIFTKAEDAS